LSTSKSKYFLSILALSALLSGCIGTRHLKENERLLFKQRINAPKYIDKEDLRTQYAQQENRKMILSVFKPLIAVYYWGERNYSPDKYVAKKEKINAKFNRKIAKTTSQKKINNYEFRRQKRIARMDNMIENGNLRMQWGEPVAVFDSALVQNTRENFADYLFSKGYFNNEVTARIIYPEKRPFLRKAVNVAYFIETGPAYIIDSLFYDVPDTTILSLVLASSKDSFVKEGKRYDQTDLTLERERIDALLRDNGYYDFSRQYIDYKVDTTAFSGQNKILMQMVINLPAKRGYHKQFTIDSVYFTTDAGATGQKVGRTSRSYRDIKYFYLKDDYNLKILSQRVFIQRGELYSRTKTFNTQRQLSNVDAFKFININFDTTGGKFIANVFSSPLPRYEWSNEAGVNVTQGFPGPFYSLSFRKRNIFNGLENFELAGRFGFEGVASPTDEGSVYRSIEAGVNASLTFPQFLFPFRERTRFKLAQYNPKTRITTGYSFTNRPEYTRSAISLNSTFTWQNNRNRTYSLTPFSVSVIDTSSVSDDFQKFLDEQLKAGNFSLYNSFRPSFVNSALFSVIWNLNNYGNIERSSGFVRATIENGGMIWNWLDTMLVTDLELQYFKFLRFGLDIRRITVINQNTTLAYRINGGVAYSYADNKSLPYEKFFFAGGSNSVRAWRPRRLGPGSFKPELSERPNKDGLYSYSIEKPADILLEASVEIRKKLFGFVSGAVFIDAGNVWTFEKLTKKIALGEVETDVDNGNSQFRIDQFYKEIAVGTGVGLRFDFTFLILRLDVGIKVIDPARDENDRFVLDKVRFWKPYATENPDKTWTNFREPVIYNVGIGYSF
jgi:outer membrane protein insertion porin family